jgi:hypothetical protein
MFGFGSGAAVVRERTGKVRLLVAMVASDLYSKTADEFVKVYEATTPVERSGGEIFFGVNLSPSCWYDVQARYPEVNPPWMDDLLGKSESTDEPQRTLIILGGGDDYGVLISKVGINDDGASVELQVVPGRRAGKDAKAMVAALLAIPDFKKPLDLGF